MLKKILLLILILSTGFSLCANAEIALNFNGFIADEANLLSEEVENDLNMTLWDLQKKIRRRPCGSDASVFERKNC